MGSNPIIGTLPNAVLRGTTVRQNDFGDCERSRTETHKDTIYLSSIRQLTAPVHAVLAAATCLGSERTAPKDSSRDVPVLLPADSPRYDQFVLLNLEWESVDDQPLRLRN